MPDADFWHPVASRSVCAWRTWPQITHQAETTNSKTEEGIFQGDERAIPKRHKVAIERHRMFRRTFEATSARGSISSPNQQDVGHVDEEKDRGLERDWLRRKPAHRHPGVESSSSEMEKRWAKLNHIKRGVASLA